MRRAALTWCLTVPLAVLGSELAHALAYRLVVADAGERRHVLEQTGHGYLEHAPLALAIGFAIVLATLVAHAAQVVRGGAPERLPAWRFALVAPLVFALQEHFERLAHTGAFPWTAALEQSFVVGLLLQLPFALLAYGLARVLLRAVARIAFLVAGRRRRLVPLAQPIPRSFLVASRRPVPSLGYGSRGPPSRAA